MDIATAGIVISGVLIPVLSFLYMVVRNIKKDSKCELDKAVKRVGKLENKTTKHEATFERLHMRIDNAEQDLSKFETSVETKLTKIEEKQDKIYELLMNRDCKTQ